jgi:hypothetical protein
MNKRHGWVLFVMCLFLMHPASGRIRHHKKQRPDMRLVEAYTQKLTPGRKEFPAETSMYIVVEWRSRESPETFFWRGDGGWLSCRTEKAHHIERPAGMRPFGGMDYTLDPPDNKPFVKGDTIMLSPVTGGKFPVPGTIPASARNTLFYKTTGSDWKAFPVDSIGRKRDILAP